MLIENLKEKHISVTKYIIIKVVLSHYEYQGLLEWMLRRSRTLCRNVSRSSTAPCSCTSDAAWIRERQWPCMASKSQNTSDIQEYFYLVISLMHRSLNGNEDRIWTNRTQALVSIWNLNQPSYIWCWNDEQVFAYHTTIACW